jgi:hypothetical protein
MRNEGEILVGKPEKKTPFGDQQVVGRIILKWILRKWAGGCGVVL